MTQERWQLLEELFHAALDRPESERQQFLYEACGSDNALRWEVESLLGSDPHTGPETPEDSSPIADRVRRAAVLVACPPRQGDRIGHYRVVEQIGQGGMGLVYRASRADQEFHMQVAIKVAKTGMAAATVLERFRRERQILASLDHRYVAKLLDGGTTSEGLPYFVMEYVEGQPIHKYARAKGLSVRQRLQLFRGVLEAVSYAHQNLVVHLDLKPSNILIAADGTPKLLDFGIARLLEDAPAPAASRSTDSNGEPASTPTGTTGFGRLLTPDYASPEQIRGEAVTTATDVYSLGAVLYQLLTGELPHQLEGLASRQVERVICALDVIPPSERNPALRRELAGDLDTIVLKAMAKDVSRRYRTAQDLDEELRRYLDGLPVRARAGSQIYSLSKFVWRNRLAAAAVAAIFASLVGVIAVTRTEARWADVQRQAAERERARAEVNAAAAERNAAQAAANAGEARVATARAEAALKEAEDARREAVRQRKNAEQGFEEARTLSDSYLFDFNDALADYPGTLALRRRMVDRGIAALDKLAQQAESSGQIHSDLASAYMRYGDLLGNPQAANLGDTKAAMDNYRKAMAMVDALPPNSQGEDLLAKMDVHRRMGEVLMDTGSATEAIDQWEKAVHYARLALKSHEGDLRFDKLTANIVTGYTHALVDSQPQKALQNIAENEPLLSRMTQLHPDNADFPSWRAAELSSKGRIVGRLARLPESKQAYQDEIAILEATEAKYPHDAVRTRLLMLAYSHLGDVLGNPQLPNLGDRQGAMAAYEKMSRIADASAGDAQNSTAQMDAAMSAGRLGGFRLGQGDAAGALPDLEKSAAGLERLIAKDPNNRIYVRYYTAAIELVGDAQDALGRKSEALATYLKEVTAAEKSMQHDPTDATTTTNFIEAHMRAAMLMAQSGDTAALPHLQAARKEAEQLYNSHPNDVRHALRWARCLGVQAVALYRLGSAPGVSADLREQRLKQAREELRRAEERLAAVPADKHTALPPGNLDVVADARKLLGAQ